MSFQLVQNGRIGWNKLPKTPVTPSLGTIWYKCKCGYKKTATELKKMFDAAHHGDDCVD